MKLGFLAGTKGGAATAALRRLGLIVLEPGLSLGPEFALLSTLLIAVSRATPASLLAGINVLLAVACGVEGLFASSCLRLPADGCGASEDPFRASLSFVSRSCMDASMNLRVPEESSFIFMMSLSSEI